MKQREVKTTEHLIVERQVSEVLRELERTQVAIGDPVQLQLKGIPDSERRNTATLLGFMPGKTVVVSVADQKDLAPFPEQSTVIVRIFSGESMHVFEAEVRKIDRDLGYIHFSYPSLVSVRTLRRSARASVHLPCVVSFEGRLIEGHIQDLSVGGARLVAGPLPVAKASLLRVEYRLPVCETGVPLTLIASVRAVNAVEDAPQPYYAYGLQFLHDDPEQKLALSAFMYEYLLTADQAL